MLPWRCLYMHGIQSQQWVGWWRCGLCTSKRGLRGEAGGLQGPPLPAGGKPLVHALPVGTLLTGFKRLLQLARVLTL